MAASHNILESSLIAQETIQRIDMGKTDIKPHEISLSEVESFDQMSHYLRSPTPQSSSSLEQTLPIAKSIPLNYREFDVPLPLVSHVRNVYTEKIEGSRNILELISKNNTVSPETLTEIDHLIDYLRKLCDHLRPTLDDLSSNTQDLAVYQAKYAENVSTKFIFLSEFLSHMKMQDRHIIVLISERELMEVIEVFLRAHNFCYSRADRPGLVSDCSGDSRMRVTILLSSERSYQIKTSDIIIAFDSSYSRIAHLAKLKSGTDTSNLSVSVIHLVITHSIQHLERELQPLTKDTAGKLQLFKLIHTAADKVGIIPRNYQEPPGAAKAVAQFYIQGEVQGSWPLGSLPDLDENIKHFQKDQISMLYGSSEELQHMKSELHSITPASLKRYSKDENFRFSDLSKRQKTEYSRDRSPKNPFTNDKSPKTTQKPSLEEDESNCPEIKFNSSIQNIVGGLENQISLTQKLNSIKIQLRDLEEVEVELRQINKDLESRRLDLEKSIRVIQPKYQEAIVERGIYENEKNLALIREANLRRTLLDRESTLAQVKKEKEETDKELKNVREALLSSSIPELRELEKMRIEVSRLKAENDLLNKQKIINQTDFDYMQTNYQKASTSAAAAQTQLRVLQGDLETLKIKAGDNAVKIHQIQHDNTIREFQLIIRGLRSEKAVLQRQVEKITDQYNIAVSGRPHTRSTSIPRSPRLGGDVASPRPMGRIINSHNTTSAIVGGISRGSSPVPVEFGAGHRNVVASYGERSRGNTPQRTENTYFKRAGNKLR
ncbi:unnamed protein product [Blumeria hordei]|uniref:Uncharacterized protein n=1 Tax=Blumeria hordei TaxID=2867405 RepID=A0A383UL25_BLUHO|nr:unnamed protein product [Blumeria hordei]